jgi:xylulokinase
MKNAGLADVEQVRISGGGAKSPIWRQILADVLNVELVTVNTTEGAAYGAALLAGVGAGTWPDVPSACDQLLQITGSTSPRQTDVYEKLYPFYQGLYKVLAPTFHGVAG